MISTKARYALRVMLDLAQQPSDQYIPLKAIAQRQNISEKYLEIILKNLVKAQFLKGLRGKGGGYMLTKKPEEYTVGMILRLTEGSLSPVDCLEEGAPVCNRMDSCTTILLWRKLDDAIRGVVDHVTLQDLVDWSQEQNHDYII